MDDLTRIGIHTRTDKAVPHRFTEIYNEYFKDLRYWSMKILEIGVANGDSLWMWAEYFPTCKIIGVDIVLPKSRVPENCSLVLRKQTDFVPQDKNLDIVVDDGSHYMNDQRITFTNILPYVRPGGWYILEDLQTSRLKEYGFNGKNSMINYLMFEMDPETKKLVDHVAIYNMVHEEGVSITSVIKRSNTKSKIQ